MRSQTDYYKNFHKNNPDEEAGRNLAKIKRLRRRTTYLMSTTHDGRTQIHAHVASRADTTEVNVEAARGRWRLIGVWKVYCQAANFIKDNNINNFEDKTIQESFRRMLDDLSEVQRIRQIRLEKEAQKKTRATSKKRC
ncbi:MAG: hypothetical protein IKZ87_00430 [Actinomycetaceae bacterium]|nr:hypothetical protein [Actinomycetaceae bacterium]